MAGKRSASSDLNHDNWDNEYEHEEAGTFIRAPTDVLKSRLIKTARRRTMPTQSDATSSEQRRVFAGFSGFSKAPANEQAVFSFLSAANSAENNTLTNNASASIENGTNKIDHSNDEYMSKLKGLNESVTKWINRHVNENPFINLQPVFGDYEKHFKEIGSKRSSTEKLELSDMKVTGANSTFNFGSSNWKPENNFVAESAPATLIFRNAASPPINSNNEIKTTVPSFNISLPASSKPSSVNFWSASKSKDSHNTTAECTTATHGHEDEENPPKNDFTPVAESDAVYEKRCKMYVKKDGSYADRGVGNLFLKPIPDSSKFQLIVRADTNIGNLLCNFVLSQSIPTKRIGAKEVMLVCMPTPDAKPPPVSILLRVKSSEDADNLLTTLDNHKR